MNGRPEGVMHWVDRGLTRPVVLVACCRSKLPQAARAADLYTSDLFHKSRAFADHYGSRWYVLSAKHGLLDPNAVIEPYDVTLSAMSRLERHEWSQLVAKQWEATALSGWVVVLAGKLYREWTGSQGFEVPMEGLGIGQQKAWLKTALKVA